MQCRIAAGVTALLLLAGPAFSQQFRGSLSGRVLDQQQGAVPNAKVTATETETGAKFNTVTNVDGTYVLPFLLPGPYTISAEAAVFNRYLNNNVRVTTNEPRRTDITLTTYTTAR